MSGKIKDIESCYHVEQIKNKGMTLWPYLRVMYSSIQVRNLSHREGETVGGYKFNLKQVCDQIRALFYGITHIWGTYSYIVLTDSSERKLMGGVYKNKLLDDVIDQLGQGKTLFVEQQLGSCLPRGQVYSTHIVSDHWIRLAAVFISKGLKRLSFLVKLEGLEVLNAIKNEMGIIADDRMLILNFDVKYKLYKKFIQWKKPELIFVTDHYSNMAFVKAAKDYGVVVVECQHGVLNETAFYCHIELDRRFTADYLLCFGENTKNTLKESRYISQDRIIPVGSAYLEYMQKKEPADQKIMERLSAYKISVAVTLSWTVEARTLEFVGQAAKLNKDIYYIIVPDYRITPKDAYDHLEMGENVIVEKEKSFYDLMPYVDFHSTVYSTCAIEAPSLGVPNILMNISGLSERHLKPLLSNGQTTKMAETPEQFVAFMVEHQPITKEKIIEGNSLNYKPNYKENIQTFIEHLKQSLEI